MFALSVLIKHPDGGVCFHDGVIHPLPIELRDDTRLRRYSEINGPGWGNSEFGYSYFARALRGGDLLIFPGLIVEGLSRITKRFYKYSHSFSKDQIESIADGIAGIADREISSFSQDQATLIHDLRALSNAIYHSAVEASTLLSNGNTDDARVRIANIIASQGMLKMRTDALDYVGNALGCGTEAEIPIYRRVDKVVRCFMPRARSQGKAIALGGSSYRKTFGPEVFELVPYGIIDNAIKYAPRGAEIEVEIEDKLSSTMVSVSSPGPELQSGEAEKIFEKGVRGGAAVATGLPGTGVGLHMVRKIVTESFRGNVTVRQIPVSVSYDGQKYFQTTFEVNLPSFS